MGAQKSAEEAGGKPQHELTKKGESKTGAPNEPKEMVGGPDMPGKPPERTPGQMRDSEAKS